MVVKSLFGATADGIQIDRYSIANASGSELTVITYGGIIQYLKVPDRNGNLENVVLGFDSLSTYLKDNQYIGAIVGRYANRIANGKFTMDGVAYALNQNDRGNHLHGGLKGFNKVVWTARIISNNAVMLSYLSPDGEEGYPGNLNTQVTYTLSDSNEVRIDFHADTDHKTIVNLVQHSYFNLSGKNQNMLDHFLQINASQYLAVNKALIPTGEISEVEGTPFDFRSSLSIGSRIDNPHRQLQYGSGYDHCLITNHPSSGIKEVAVLHHHPSGRLMSVFTDMPGLHLYTDNFLTDNFPKHAGVCLETQHFPDAPNHAHFPSPVVEPGKPYNNATIFKFLVQ